MRSNFAFAPQIAIGFGITVSNDNVIQGLKHLSATGQLPKKQKGTKKPSLVNHPTIQNQPLVTKKEGAVKQEEAGVEKNEGEVTKKKQVVKEKEAGNSKAEPHLKQADNAGDQEEDDSEGEGEEKPLDKEAVGLFVKEQLKEGTNLKELYHAVILEHGKEAQALVKQAVKHILELRKQGIVLGNQHAPVASKFGSSFGPLVQAVNTIKLSTKKTPIEAYETQILYSNWKAAKGAGSNAGSKAG
ncbi:MAG TPA: hypothetical protein VJZ75_08690 [Candidatus Bathyarchaeia archaeon]|nr:hypothetical protein [Candidatus Bathyarchaeia archaeon]